MPPFELVAARSWRFSEWDPIDDRLAVHDEVVRSLVVVPEDEDVLEL